MKRDLRDEALRRPPMLMPPDGRFVAGRDPLSKNFSVIRQTRHTFRRSASSVFRATVAISIILEPADFIAINGELRAQPDTPGSMGVNPCTPQGYPPFACKKTSRWHPFGLRRNLATPSGGIALLNTRPVQRPYSRRPLRRLNRSKTTRQGGDTGAKNEEC
jgi:hypothetical protein